MINQERTEIELLNDIITLLINGWKEKHPEDFIPLNPNLVKYQGNSQESSKVEKLDEMPDYETTNEVETLTRDTNSSNIRTHPDTFSTESELILKAVGTKAIAEEILKELNKDYASGKSEELK